MAAFKRFEDSLMLAVMNGNVEETCSLVEHGAPVNQEYAWGHPIQLAVDRGHEKLIRELARLGADVNAVGERGRPPVSSAAGSSFHLSDAENLAILDLLLDLGADPNLLDAEGRSPIQWALWKGKTGAACRLAERGADPSRTDRLGNNALDYAHHFRVEEAILPLSAWWENQANEQIARTRMRFEIIERSLQGDVEGLRQLFLHGAEINAISPHGRDALFSAASKRHLEAMRILLEHGANPNNLAGGNTALMAAAYAGSRPAVDLLIDAGADLFARFEVMPRHFIDAPGFAREGLHRELVAYLAVRMKKT